jgi:hypothetical protein
MKYFKLVPKLEPGNKSPQNDKASNSLHQRRFDGCTHYCPIPLAARVKPGMLLLDR